MRLPERGRGLPGRLARLASAAWQRAPFPEPWRALVPLLLAHWLALVVFALFGAHRNGWLFYQGGDQIWYWTNAWLLGHGLIAPSYVSLGWPFLLLPLAVLRGPAYVDGLPFAVLLQTLLLAPLALWAVYELAARTAGRVVGYLAAGLWTLLPYLSIPFWDPRYHEKFVDFFLPQALGLTGMSDYASMVLLLAGAALALRAYNGGDLWTAALAGIAVGTGGLVKSSSILFAPLPLIVLLARGRRRELVAFAVATAPAWLALALWKYRGLGTLPAFNAHSDEVRLALGTDTLTRPYHRYVHVDWHQLHLNLLQIREFFYSVRILEWAPFAGAIAVARRSPRIALFLSAWFWVFLIVKGAQPLASVENTSFFRFVLPGFPALLVMVACLPLLLPRVGPQLVSRFPAGEPRRTAPLLVAAAVVLLGVLPLAAVAAGTPLRADDPHAITVNGILVPVDAGFRPTATPVSSGVVVEWPARTSSSRLFYRLIRTRGRTDVSCTTPAKGAATCALQGEQLSSHRDTSTLDKPRSGTWTYRIGVAANYADDPEAGDVFVVSRSVTVTVR